MSLKNAIRRLLKSRLRLHILKALLTERTSESWASVIEVEKGIAEDAWDAWTKVRSSHALSLVEEAAPVALQEAVKSVRETFSEVAKPEWLVERIQTFVDDFPAF